MDLRVGRLPKIRVLPKPEESLRTLVGRAPEAEAWADRTMERLRPAMMRLYGIRRRLATSLVGLFTVWLFIHVMLGANGMVVYRQKKNEIQDLQKQVDALQKENDQYTQQIKALRSDPKMIEKVAREQLQYTRPGEVVYVAPEPPAHPRPPATNAARK
jgi:cell division protein FtsB